MNMMMGDEGKLNDRIESKKNMNNHDRSCLAKLSSIPLLAFLSFHMMCNPAHSSNCCNCLPCRVVIRNVSGANLLPPPPSNSSREPNP